MSWERQHGAAVPGRSGVRAAAFASIDDALRDMAAGRMVVVVDSPHRENEGDLVLAADRVTPEAVNFMATHGRGLICLATERSVLERLEIPPMVAQNTDARATAFHVSVDVRDGTTTGISASDRAATIRRLADRAAVPADFTRPGHVFPLAARDGGVLRRPGHTEASVDLARMAGRRPAGVICEIARPDGEMARLPQLLRFAEEHGLAVITIEDIVAFRRASVIDPQPANVADLRTQRTRMGQVLPDLLDAVAAS